MKHMVLRNVIGALKELHPDFKPEQGFADPHSYRGDYACLSFQPSSCHTIGEMLAAAEFAVQKTFRGYKGGDFHMDLDTPCYVAPYGSTGEPLTPSFFRALHLEQELWLALASGEGSLIPFDLKKALAGAKVQTRNGEPVTGLVRMEGVMAPGRELAGVLMGSIETWQRDGSYAADESIHDLFMAPSRTVRWLNVYDAEQAYLYRSREEADSNLSDLEGSRLACIRVEWEE